MQQKIAQLRDSDIRSALREKLRMIHADEPDTAIIDELSLSQGQARVDLAVVNGSFSGYEIKSDRDTLIRLPGQRAVYELCFNTITIVVGSAHVEECIETLPGWWGIWEAIPQARKQVDFLERREPENNMRITPEQVVQLLWREEVAVALRTVGIAVPAKTTRRELWRELVEALDPEELFRVVRERLRARGDWRSGSTPFRNDGLSLSAANFRRSQACRTWLLSLRSQRRPN